MARPRKLSLDEMITKQEQVVANTQDQLDAEKAKLSDLYAKRDETQQQALIDALETSNHSYDEIMAFLQS